MPQSRLIDPQQLSQAIQEGNIISVLKGAIRDIAQTQKQQFDNGGNIVHLVHERARAIDDVLSLCWQHHGLDRMDTALVAVGGYGRGELHPQSDIDFLILHDDPCIEQSDPQDTDCLGYKLQQFITLLWDIGLQPGHAVRTVAQCVAEAKEDVTIITNLIESRMITGNQLRYQQLQNEISPKKIWPTKDFVCAKIAEQKQRYLKFNETAYNLEPNIKESPGGLRDIQMIGWIAKRYFRASTLKELVAYKFISAEEYEQLEKGQVFLWQIRFALHSIKNRCEDRLLFDFQRILAEQFGFVDNEEKLAVEQFMKKYYQVVMEIERLNEILLQYFNEVIIYKDVDRNPVIINKRFVLYKDYISTANPNIFYDYPFALLEIFLILAENPQIKGIRASTIRQIRNNKYLIDDTFRKDLRCRSLFMEILRQKQGITLQIRRMNRYGVLAAYIPVFEKIVGQMQHDLYHAYTVDEHTLRVLRNVRRFSVHEFANEMPLASKVFRFIPKPELLYLAALFHDIGKGRGGNHSLLGAVDAEQFCQLHDLPSEDIRLVSWLVKNHLEMSTTAQRKDLGDPKVIHDFALQMHDLNHLNYLYLLTVADIRGTSPKVWNSWKDSLLMELYNLTKQALSKGLNHPLEQDDKIKQLKLQAIKLLSEKKITASDCHQLWSKIPRDYFLQHNIEEIVWHTENIIDFDSSSQQPLVSIRNLSKKGSTEILIYMQRKPHIFTIVTSTLAQMSLNVIEANTYRMTGHCILHTYHILDEQDETIADQQRVEEIRHRLQQQLGNDGFNLEITRTILPRALKQFSIETEIRFDEDFENNLTIMHLTASNRPFLLSKIGHVLIEQKIHLVNAKIATFGEKVEDIFYITDQDDCIITDFEQLQRLKKAIIEALDENS